MSKRFFKAIEKGSINAEKNKKQGLEQKKITFGIIMLWQIKLECFNGKKCFKANRKLECFNVR
jgi:hypothetical protein